MIFIKMTLNKTPVNSIGVIIIRNLGKNNFTKKRTREENIKGHSQIVSQFFQRTTADSKNYVFRSKDVPGKKFSLKSVVPVEIVQSSARLKKLNL